jgi:hypothetical protein
MEGLTPGQILFVSGHDNLPLQWEQSMPVFDQFYAHLQAKGLKAATIAKKMNCAIIFIMNYLYPSGMAGGMTDVTGDTVRSFMDGYFTPNFPSAPPREAKSFKKALLDFFKFLKKNRLISSQHLRDIADACLEDHTASSRPMPGEISGLPALPEAKGAETRPAIADSSAGKNN